MTERKASKEGFEIVTGRASTVDRHPKTLPDAGAIDLKLIFKTSGVLLGVQVTGGDSMGEMINVLGLAIQKGLTANELNTFQVAAHSLITSSPVNYPINAAALDALIK
ncbi:MAG: NAD(FAD)-dependent dehydrogenase [Desulfotomaculum sp. 46_80]|nr:MAG: NAD(FAD)-dependent dehydrogenase [Desulfotomaculum sp. 46_80]